VCVCVCECPSQCPIPPQHACECNAAHRPAGLQPSAELGVGPRRPPPSPPPEAKRARASTAQFAEPEYVAASTSTRGASFGLPGPKRARFNEGPNSEVAIDMARAIGQGDPCTTNQTRRPNLDSGLAPSPETYRVCPAVGLVGKCVMKHHQLESGL
jgi:hypothetical protein